MAAPAPLLRGPLAGHPVASQFAAEVHRVHRRYATEIVAANRLCPFLRDVDTGFGAFVVMLDAGEPDVDATVDAILAASNAVVHVIFPLIRPQPSAWERFSGRVGQALKRMLPRAPVMAAFHPELAGDTDDPHRLVGILRRAPDPFVQVVPAGMTEGGTVFSPNVDEAMASASIDSATDNFAKLGGERAAPLVAKIAEIHDDRAKTYASFVEAFGLDRAR